MNVTTELKELIEQATSQILCMQVHINKGYGANYEKIHNLSVGYNKAELDEFVNSFDYDENFEDQIHCLSKVTVWFIDDSWATLDYNDDGNFAYWYYHVKPQLV